MPTPTYTPLANITLGSSAATVSFGSIPNTYRDLILVIQVITSGTSEVRARFNGDAGANYSHQAMQGNGTTASATTQTGQADAKIAKGINTISTSASMVVANIMDYSATDKHKTLLSRNDRAAGGTEAIVNRWANTAAITSIQLSLQSTTTFSAGSSFALYGIVA